MKNLLLLLSALLIFSCSVQKRKYQKGYYVSWGKSAKVQKATCAKTAVPKKPAVVAEQLHVISEPVEITASIDKPVQALTTKKHPLIPMRDDPCDVLIYRDGTEVSAKVLEITPTEIKYKKCEMLDGPTYVARKGEVFMVKYGNGTREVFKEESTTTNPAPQGPKQNKYQGPKQVHPLAVGALIFAILGIFPLTLIGSIIGFIMAKSAEKRISAQPDLYKGQLLVDIAKVICKVIIIIFAVLLGLAILGVLLTL